MLLELGKGLAFFASLISLSAVVVPALLTPQMRWRDRVLVVLLRMLLAGVVALGAGVVFRWPSPRNPDADRDLTATLPVRLFLFALPLIVIVFALTYYFGCVAPLSEVVPYSCR